MGRWSGDALVKGANPLRQLEMLGPRHRNQVRIWVPHAEGVNRRQRHQDIADPVWQADEDSRDWGGIASATHS